MKIKYLIVIILGIASFYYSDKLIIYIENNSSLMKEIISNEDKYNTLPINAVIENDTIIPGVKGREINRRETYLKMNEFKVFNDTFMIYNYIKPETSLDDNLDKFIVSSRHTDQVAIVTNNKKVSEYLENNNIKHSLIIMSNEQKKSSIEYINGHGEINEYKKLEQYLNKNKNNKKICIEGINDINYCINNKYYLVRINNILNKTNFYNSINKIEGGSFIFIDDILSDNELEIIINKIKKNNLTIDYLSVLISEK